MLNPPTQREMDRALKRKELYRERIKTLTVLIGIETGLQALDDEEKADEDAVK